MVKFNFQLGGTLKPPSGLSRFKRSTMGKKKWQTIDSRNFGKRVTVCTSVHPIHAHMSLSMSFYSRRYTKTRKMTIACQLHLYVIHMTKSCRRRVFLVFRLNFNIYSDADNIQRAGAKKITKIKFICKRNVNNFIVGVRKRGILAATDSENEGN